MKTHCIWRVCAYGILLMSTTGLLMAVQAVSPFSHFQEFPDVDNGVIVWAEWVQNNDWDIYGVDLFNPAAGLIEIAVDPEINQRYPAIWFDRVVYQDDTFIDDWDVRVADISDPNIVAPNYLITDFTEDQINPVIHGNTVVWQDYIVFDGGEDWDIYAADITDPNNPWIFVVDGYSNDQQMPAVYRNRIVYQEHSNSNSDIWSVDVWLKDIPQYETVIDNELPQTYPAVWEDIVVYEHEISATDVDIYARDMSQPNSEPFIIADSPGLQLDPDISGHIIVWQDDRNTDWDIYGYNLITKKEFRITTDGNHQTQPAISGSLVVWKDARDDPANIYYTWLDETDAADCPNPLVGDINGDCRVNLNDYALLAQEWLTCALDPISACANEF